MDQRTDMLYRGMEAESKFWVQALRNVRCILPDDAADVEVEVRRLRQKEMQRLAEIAQVSMSRDPQVSKIQ